MTNDDKDLKPLNDECIPFLGAISSNGYGAIRLFGKQRLAHVVAFKMFYPSRIIGKKCVCHKCDNKICINPKHLFLGTREQNNKDRDLKGRHVKLCGPDNGMSKLSKDDIREIKYRLANKKSMASIGRDFNVTYQNIQAIKKGKTWKNV